MRIALLALTSAAVFGNTIVTLNTAPLQTSSAGPFTLDFQFLDGDGTGDGNNTVTLSNFTFGGGSVNTTPSFSTGGINVTTGPFGVTLTDTAFYNDVEFSLTPGSSLSFALDSTSNPDTSAPDTFTFAIFDGSGNEISTTNPNGLDSFLELDLPTGSTPITTILSGSAPGASVMLAPPVESSGGTTTPEPSAFIPLVGALTVLVARGAYTRACRVETHLDTRMC